MSNPWDAPAALPFGDARPDDTYKAVGKALSSWELVEEELARLFGLFTGPTQKLSALAPAMRAYGSVVSFQGRREMVRVAGASFFYGFRDAGNPCPFEQEFSPLLDQCGGWSGRRNDVAHGRVEQIPAGCYLYPGLYNTKKQPLGEPPAYFYTSAQILAFAAAFEDLADRLSEYATQLNGWLYTSSQSTTERPTP